MKITVDLDCTPNELRTFMGLPDLEPMQQAVLTEMQRRMISAMDHMSPTAIMKDWLTPMGAAQQALFGAFAQGASAAARTARGGRSSTSRTGTAKARGGDESGEAAAGDDADGAAAGSADA
ncbi:MAG: hypothetical protein IPK37_08750 [Austwickia sp.]|jgi:hypothetical protein|nr:MAG: hypothetical protein IPK37_08750 [Austwickia sp.]